MHEKVEKYLSLEECKHGRIYKILSRNLAYGVFNEETKGFTGLRTKFEDVYLFEEYHWDTGIPYGTVKPLEMTDYVWINEEDKLTLKSLLFQIEYKNLKQENLEFRRELYILKKEFETLKNKHL